jgi:hypothetical protein
MTQERIEAIARRMRGKCLHSSWSDFVGFWEEALGSLEKAYRMSAWSASAYRDQCPAEAHDTQRMVRDELAKAWGKLTGGIDLPESAGLHPGEAVDQ